MTILTDGRIPVWLSHSEGEMCRNCTRQSVGRISDDSYCDECLPVELSNALKASKIVGAIRNEPLPKVGV